MALLNPPNSIGGDRSFGVELTGRSWEDENGLHTLCMVNGKVFELSIHMAPAGWWLRAARKLGSSGVKERDMAEQPMDHPRPRQQEFWF